MILRAILGGLIGGFLWIVLPMVFMGGLHLGVAFWALLGYVFFGLPIGAAIGGATGFVIWLLNRPLHTVFRVAIGVGIASIALVIVSFLTVPPSSDLTVMDLWYALVFSLAIGVPSGLMARRARARVP